MDINKAIQRSLTKACARHGLGLYIYAGEDLPEGVEPEYKPISNDKYWQVVAAHAEKRLAKSGRTQREEWIRVTNAKEKHIAKFDNDVMNYKITNNLK